ncbi:MAG: hypothetical protein AMXMBFR33_12460 [Candidatus Xenobia bacterium]
MKDGVISALRSRLSVPEAWGPASKALKLSILTFAAQIVAMAASPILTRLFTPSDLGILGVFGATVTLISLLSFFRYEQAIPLAEGDEGGAGILQLCHLCLLVSVLLLSGAVWMGGPELMELMLIPSLAPYRVLLPLGVLGAGIYTLSEFWLIRQRRYSFFGLTRIIQIVVMIALQIVAGICGVGVVGLLAGQVIGMAFGGVLVLAQLWFRRPVGWRQISYQAHRYRHFGFYTSWSTMIKAAALQGPILLIAHFYGTQVTGWFNLALRAVTIPGDIFAKALSRVFLGEAARLQHENRRGLLSLFWPILRLQAMIGVGIAIGTVVAAPLAFKLVFGAAWTQSGVYAQYLSLAMLAQFIVSPIENFLTVAERQGLYAFREVLRGLLSLGPLCVAFWMKASPNVAILCFSLGAASFELVSLALATLALRSATQSPMQSEGNSEPSPSSSDRSEDSPQT